MQMSKEGPRKTTRGILRTTKLGRRSKQTQPRRGEKEREARKVRFVVIRTASKRKRGRRGETGVNDSYLQTLGRQHWATKRVKGVRKKANSTSGKTPR